MSRNVCTGRVTYKPKNVPFFINPQFKNADLILLNLLWQGITDEIGNLTMEIIILPLPPAGKGGGEGGVRIYPPHLHLPPPNRPGRPPAQVLQGTMADGKLEGCRARSLALKAGKESRLLAAKFFI